MTLKRYPRNEMTREQWLDARLANINASEAAVVCGVAPWGSPAVLFAEKKGLRPPLADNAIFRRGRWGEASVFEALAEIYPDWEIVRASVYAVDEDKRQGSTPDGFARRPEERGVGAIQTKVISRSVFRQKYLDDPADDIRSGAATLPPAYRIQTLQDMRINECEWGCVPILVVGEYDWTFRIFDVERDPVLEARIDHLIAQFFADYLDPGIMPPFEPTRDSELIRQLYPRDDGTTIDLREDNRAMQLVDDLAEVSAALKRMKDRKDEITTELEGKLAAHTFGLLADGRCLANKLQRRKAHPVKASEFRVLRVLKNAPEAIEEEVE